MKARCADYAAPSHQGAAAGGLTGIYSLASSGSNSSVTERGKSPPERRQNHHVAL